MLGLSTAITRAVGAGRQYIKDGLKLYMPYKGADTTKGTQFVGTGSTSFDGDDYVGIADDSTLDITDNLTVSCWAKNDSDAIGASQALASKYKSSGEDSRSWLFYFDTAEKLVLTTSDDGESGTMAHTSDSAVSNVDTWNHYVFTFVGGTVTFYVNGVSVANTRSGETQTAIASDDADMSIGSISEAGGFYWEGNIKNVAIWNRALTATEVQNVMYKSYAEVSGRLGDSTLVAWWSLDGEVGSDGNAGSGYILNEVAGAGSTTNLGTITGATVDTDLYGGDTPVIPRAIDNAPTVQADAIGSGSALFVGGSGDKIVIADDSTLDITDTISICLWVKPTQQRWQGIIDKGALDGVASGDYSIYLNNASPAILQFGLNGASRATTSAAIPLNEWTHIACTYDKDAGGEDEAKVYLNGVLSKEGNYSTVIATSSTALNLGIYLQAYSLSGNLCQVGIWDAVLDQAQIQSVMEKTYEELTASEKEDLVSYWALDVDGSDSHGDNDGTLT